MMLREIADGVFVFPHRHVDGKNAIVFGSTAALAVDACMHTDEGDAMASFIRDQDHTPDLLAVTHGHPDHILGSRAFRCGEVIAHSEHDKLIQSVVAQRSIRTGQEPEEILADIARPTVTFTEERRIDLGDREVLMFHSPGHTADSACVYVADQKVLVAGDTLVTGIIPAFTDGDSRILETTVRRILNLDVEHLIPGHGPVVSGVSAVSASLRWTIDYLSGVRARVGEVGAEATDDELLSAIPFDEFAGDRFDQTTHGMMTRHQTAVLTVAAELSGTGHTDPESRLPNQHAKREDGQR